MTSARARFAFWTLVILLCVRFVDVYAVESHQASYTRLEVLLAGAADTPFQYRLLSPILIAAISRISGLHLFVAAAAYNLLCLLVFVASLWRVLITVGADRRLCYLAVASVFYPLWTLLVTLEYLQLWYPWDLAQLALAAIALWSLLERRWVVYFALFAIATLNRETSYLFLCQFIAVVSGRWPWHRLACAVTAQVAWWLAVKLVLAAVFRANPGYGLAAFMLIENMRALILRPMDGLTILAVASGAWIPVAWMWRSVANEELRRTLIGIVPHLIILVCTALLYEPRVYLEMLPAVWTAGTLLVQQWLGIGVLHPLAESPLQTAVGEAVPSLGKVPILSGAAQGPSRG